MPEENLQRLLEEMSPRLGGDFAFCFIDEPDLITLDVAPLCLFREEEGVTVVLPHADALRLQLGIVFDAALITLTVHSDLYAVGFLAVICSRLAEEGISVNVVSAVHHDHLFVPRETAEKAFLVLKEIEARAAKSLLGCESRSEIPER